MKPNKNYSERQLRADLASFREEVAAPRDFRASIIRRLAIETGQAAPAPKISVFSRVAALFSRPLLVSGLAAAACLALGLYVAMRPVAAPISQVESTPPAVEPGMVMVPRVAEPRVVAKAKPAPKAVEIAKAPQVQVPAEEQSLSGASAAPAAPAVGALPESGSGATKFSGVTASGNPTAGPTAGTDPSADKPMKGESQVRRNRFLASKGEYAAILLHLKAPGHARVEVYDRNGKLVSVLHDGDHSAGTFEVHWYGFNEMGQPAPTGIYMIRVKTSEYEDRHKAVLVR